MIYQSLAFWALLAATASVFALSPAQAVGARAATLAIISAAALAIVVKLDPWFAIVLALSVLWIAAAAKRAAASKSRRRGLIYLLAPIAIVWIATKLMVVSDAGWVQFIGYSYLFIKAWTLLKDVQDGRIADPNPAVVVAYLLHFPTFVSGPMHLFGEFDASMRAPAFPDLEGLVDVVFRILLGLVKVKVVAPLFDPISLDALSESGQISPATLALGSIAYSVVVWANFSGYTDLAIATSRLIGVYTPENFNYPYAAPNIREFWQRWHISFTRVLTSYVFIPLSRRLQRRMPGKPRTLMVVSTLITFLFCGFWHGATPNFVVWGLYHAVGLIIYDFYRPGAMRRRARRKTQPHAALVDRLERAFGIALTFAFVSAGWIFFVFPLSRLFGV